MQISRPKKRGQHQHHAQQQQQKQSTTTTTNTTDSASASAAADVLNAAISFDGKIIFALWKPVTPESELLYLLY